MNIWTDISPARITPSDFVACIEIEQGSKNKYELDKETGFIILDRVLYTSTHYPMNYGFIPRTYSDDKDPLDVFVLCSQPIEKLSLVRCYHIGVVKAPVEGEVMDVGVTASVVTEIVVHVNAGELVSKDRDPVHVFCVAILVAAVIAIFHVGAILVSLHSFKQIFLVSQVFEGDCNTLLFGVVYKLVKACEADLACLWGLPAAGEVEDHHGHGNLCRSIDGKLHLVVNSQISVALKPHIVDAAEGGVDKIKAHSDAFRHLTAFAEGAAQLADEKMLKSAFAEFFDATV